MLQWWGRNFLVADLCLSGLVTLACWLASLLGANPGDLLEGRRPDLYATLTAVFAPLAGFALTTWAIVVGLASTDSDRMQMLRASELFHDIWDTFASAALMSGAATVACLLGLLTDRAASPWSWPLWLTAGILVAATLRMARTVWILHGLTTVVFPRNRT